MDHTIMGSTIRRLREKRVLTQAELAERIGVSDKAVSKWETAKGLPDLAMMEPLACALGVSVMELLSGEPVINRNRSANMFRTRFYVCPFCGNVVHTIGETLVSCCGTTLPVCDAEGVDAAHSITIERVEDEHFIFIDHPMEKSHYISFVAYVTSDRLQMVKLYPEGNAETRLQLRGRGILYFYCNRHGLMKKKL